MSWRWPPPETAGRPAPIQFLALRSGWRRRLVIINTNMELLTDEDQQRLADLEVAVYHVNATEIALEIANTELSTNMGMIGSVAGITKCVTMAALDLALQDRFGRKYVASGGTATLDQAITKKFAKKELLLAKNLAVVKKAYEIGAGWAEKNNAGLMVADA